METQKKLLVLLVFVLVFLLCGCPQSKNDIQQYFIKGKILHSCDNPIPVKNTNIDFELAGFYPTSQTVATSTTDSNGNFYFSYSSLTVTSHNPSISMGILAGASYNEIIGFDVNKSIDAGNVYSQSNYFFVLKISTDSAYTSNDSLITYENGVYNPKYTIGPFYSGQIIDTINSSMSVNFNHPENNGLLLQWRFPQKISTIKYNQFSNCVQCMRYNVLTLQLHK